MTQSRAGAPWLVWGSSAKCFHFYTLTGSQVLSGCQLLGTNFSPLHIKVLLVYPHVFSLFFSSLPQNSECFFQIWENGLWSQNRWACGLIMFSPLPNPNACCHQCLQRGPQTQPRSPTPPPSFLGTPRSYCGSCLIQSQLLLPVVTYLWGILFLLCVFNPSLSFSSFP